MRRVKASLALAVVVLVSVKLHAQEAELPPIVVTGTFELRQGPSVVDLFAAHLARQIESKRAFEATVAATPILNASFWKYLPIRLQDCSSDSSQFFTPSYLSSDYRNAERALEASRKESLFEGR
jgi:hypothetical protein